MKNVVVLLVAALCLSLASGSILEKLKGLSKETLFDLCDKINDPSHQLWSPLRCMKEGESMDFGRVGREFKASHKIDAATLNPVVLLPGLGGSGLDAQIHKNSSKAWYCFKTLDWFRIWFAVEEIVVQPCWMDNLDVTYNPATDMYNNTYGVEIRPADFGGIKGVSYLDYVLGLPIWLTSYYSDVVKSLQEVGYVVGKNLHGAPYDWRLPAPTTAAIGWYAQLQALIEQTYTANGNLPVHVVTHSMGGPTGLYFLNSMPQAWLDKYIASFIPIAGPWTGAPNALRAVLSGDNFGLSVGGIDIIKKWRFRDIARNAGGIMELIPNTDINTATRAFVNVAGVNYTIKDFPELFNNVIQAPESGQVYADVQNVVENLVAPNVPVHCVYGYGVPTEDFYTYATPDFSKDPIIDLSDPGDGTVPSYSLRECNTWQHTQSQPVEIQEFNLVGHSDILHDDEFIKYLLTVVTKQN